MAAPNEYCKVRLEIDRIDSRPAAQMRAKVNQDVVDEYAEDFDKLPPMRVIVDGDDIHWLVDGSYRLKAALKLGKKRVECLVRSGTGTYAEAYAEACRSNDTHGVRVTNEDKCHRVREALKDAKMKTWSSRMLADHCGVSHRFVLGLRPNADDKLDTVSSSKDDDSPRDDSPPKLVGKDGKARPARRKSKQVDDPDMSQRKGKASSNGKSVDKSNIDSASLPRLPYGGLHNTSTPIVEDESPEGDDPADEGEVYQDERADVEANAEAYSDDTREDEFDWDAWWAEHERAIRARFMACPEDARSYFAMKLSTLARILIGSCPDIVDRSGEIIE